MQTILKNILRILTWQRDTFSHLGNQTRDPLRVGATDYGKGSKPFYF